MITLNDYFQKIIWIGSVNRPDRAEAMLAQLEKFQIVAERFEAHWKPLDHTGKPNANFGCTSSHRGVYELICHHQWPRTLILEDDAEFVGESWPDQFDAMIRECPAAWDFLFLGAGYAEDPIARVNGSFIRAGRLLTTSSYGITHAMALRIAPHISGIGPIDSLLGGWQREATTLIFTPRLCVQADSYSDLAENFSRNRNSMLDTRHEDLM